MSKNGTVDYSKSLIYKLCCNDTDITDIYIGSTTNMKNRKYQHKSTCHNENNKNYKCHLYQFIRDTGGFSNWSMILVDYVDVNNKQELLKKEREYIDKLKPALNRIIPTRTPQEYYEKNKQKIQEHHKEHYENNKQKILEQTKERYEKNKEKHLAYAKKYYENNKKTKITCECGCIVKDIYKHTKSKKHIKLMECK